DGQGKTNSAEKRERTLRSIKSYDGQKYPDSIAPSAQFRFRSSGASIIWRRDFRDRQLELERMYGKLGLNLEPPRKNRKGFHETAGKHAVSGQDIGEARVKHRRQERSEQPVTGTVTKTISLLLLINPCGHHHVEPFLNQPMHHDRSAGRIVRRVPVHQNVDV